MCCVWPFCVPLWVDSTVECRWMSCSLHEDFMYFLLYCESKLSESFFRINCIISQRNFRQRICGFTTCCLRPLSHPSLTKMSLILSLVLSDKASLAPMSTQVVFCMRLWITILILACFAMHSSYIPNTSPSCAVVYGGSIT